MDSNLYTLTMLGMGGGSFIGVFILLGISSQQSEPYPTVFKDAPFNLGMGMGL